MFSNILGKVLSIQQRHEDEQSWDDIEQNSAEFYPLLLE